MRIMLMDLLKTGIAGFDEFLRGGLPPRTYLLLGSPGSGNEVFARQVAYYRSEKVGVSYITYSKTPECIREDMACFNWDISAKEKKGTWRFITLNKDSLEVISKEVEQRRCIVLDSLSELLLKTKINDVVDLLNFMSNQSREKKEMHLILLSEGMQEPRIEIMVQHFVGGIIYFTSTWRGEASTNNLSIRKIEGSMVPTRSLPYAIGSRGIAIETATRIT
jgi:KaiC/GvpD/RAD55 family RecA-like ATPase